MQLNYSEGMFLGRQELFRRQLLEKVTQDVSESLFVDSTVAPESLVGFWKAPCDPGRMQLRLLPKTVGGIQGIAVGINAEFASVEANALGRVSIGGGIGVPILDDDWTGKEGFASVRYETDGTWYVQIKGEQTNYENALISVSSTGLGTFPKGWDHVKDLFRSAEFGRQTVVCIEGAGDLFVSSVDSVNHTVQFVGVSGSFTVVANARFYLKTTMSPFIVTAASPLYSYDSLSVRLDSDADAPAYPWFTIGKVVVESGSVVEYEVFSCKTENNKYGYRETVGYQQIETRHLADGCVTGDKLAIDSLSGLKIVDGSITTDKLADGSIVTSKIADEAVNLTKIARAGVLPTDIFRVDAHYGGPSGTSFDLSQDGGGIGAVLVQGYQNNFFSYDPSHPDSPYRIRQFYNSTYPKILAFIPVSIPYNAPRSFRDVSIASPFVHFTEDGITCQIIFFLSQPLFDVLYGLGFRTMSGIITGNIYGDVKNPVTVSVSLSRVNIFNVNITQQALNTGDEQHVILDFEWNLLT